jgi:hypothetical protein
MTLNRFLSNRPAGLLASLVVFAALGYGCGSDDGLGRRYPVSGKVTYNGKPLAKGSISFIPDDPKTGRAASGSIVEGNYSLTTQAPDDGALPGSYKVTVQAAEVDLTNASEKAKKSGMMIDQRDIAKAKRTNLIPTKYLLPESSGLTAQVKAQSNKIDFPLTD